MHKDTFTTDDSSRATPSSQGSSHREQKLSPVNVDGAWDFLREHGEAASRQPDVDIDALRRKIDWHIVPLMFCCYTLQFLDKVILNVCRSTHTNAPVWHQEHSLTRRLVVCSGDGHQSGPEPNRQRLFEHCHVSVRGTSLFRGA